MRRIISSKIIDPAGANNMTGAAVVLSEVIDTSMISQTLAIEYQWTGTPTGTLTGEFSSSYDPIGNPNALFISLATFGPFPTFATFPIAGAPGSGGGSFSLQGLARYFRIRYVNSAGSGQLSVFLHSKGRN